jgi:6-phosphogluconate dehydrogenase
MDTAVSSGFARPDHRPDTLQLGMIGLGRMGSSMVRRLLLKGHGCVVHDVHPEAVASLQAIGAVGVRTLLELVARMERPRSVWLMVPAAMVDQVLDELVPLLSPGDVVIDGGNSHYRDDLRRSGALRARSIHHVDVGTSGGIAGLKRGYCLMIGGEEAVVNRLRPLFSALASGVDAAPRSEGRTGDPADAEEGYLHCGPHGAGHFVKMVHNGIEYGVMAAYAEGLNILRRANIGSRRQEQDAETAPLSQPELYQYDMNIPEIAEVWRRGSVIGSWVLDLVAAALHQDPELRNYEGSVADSGEGRWTIQAAIDEAVPVPVLSAALYERFASRGNSGYANRLLSAMRHEFGGHVERGTP